jgi:hypothetical protein
MTPSPFGAASPFPFLAGLPLSFVPSFFFGQWYESTYAAFLITPISATQLTAMATWRLTEKEYETTQKI